MQKKKSITDLIVEYFKTHPRQDLSHGPVVDWVEMKYKKMYNKKPRDTWRAIRQLHEKGFLVKVKKGIYRHDPDAMKKIELFDFPLEVKEQIFKRDNYKCIFCGRGPKDGVEICADHILSKNKGGTNTLDNGQTLCMEHNLMKKNYSQTEAGKRYFIKIYKKALIKKDGKIIKFCKCVFECYNKHKINSHIPRPNGK